MPLTRARSGIISKKMTREPPIKFPTMSSGSPREIEVPAIIISGKEVRIPKTKKDSKKGEIRRVWARELAT